MPQAAQNITEEVREVIERVITFQRSGLRPEEMVERLAMLQAFRGSSRERSKLIDELLIRQIMHLRSGLAEAADNQNELKAMIESLLAPPWHIALFLRLVSSNSGLGALVLHGGSPRVVSLANGVETASLAEGDEVFLSHELNAVIRRSEGLLPRGGETAFFERHTSDGRIVLRWRDEEVVVGVAGCLREVELKPGDQIRWERAAWMAFEKIERNDGQALLLDEVPNVGRDQIGGQDENVDTLLSVVTATLVAPEKALLYGLSDANSILLCGPPGCGKTLMARIVASEVTRLGGRRCRVCVVKPAEWESPWVGEAQANIRKTFKVMREAAVEGPAILFLDEIEAVGRVRGSAVGHHSDKFLAALLAELDGFKDRSGVAVIAATNRKDLVDPALLERLSDVEIAVRRPDMRGARRIFEIHLSETVPYWSNGKAAEDTREAIIDRAVSLFYSPNGGNELCLLRFRDGKTRTATARELASGRTFEQICRSARRRALLRDIREEDAGLRVSDMDEAIAEAKERLSSTLTIRNAHVYLPDLPQDVDVVSVEPIQRKVARPHRYIRPDA